MAGKTTSRRIARERFWGERDKEKYQCPDCGRGKGEICGSFEVHHKNGEAYDNRMDNLIGLCSLCHALREGRRPSRDSIRGLLNRSEGRAVDDGKRYGFGMAHQAFTKLAQKLYPRDGMFPDGGRISEMLGYDSSEELFGVRPNTRREVALWMAAQRKEWEVFYNILGDLDGDYLETQSCEICGGGGGGSFLPDFSLLHENGQLDDWDLDSRYCCSDCVREVYDSVTAQSEVGGEIQRRISGRSGHNGQAGLNKDEEAIGLSKIKKHEECMAKNCESSPDFLFQFEPAPDIDKIWLMWGYICSDCIDRVDEDFTNGMVIGSLDAVKKLWEPGR